MASAKYVIRRVLKKKSLLFKVVISYVLIGGILISVLSFMLYERFVQSSIQDITEVSEKMLQQSYGMTDASWQSVYNYISRTYMNDKVLISAFFSDNLNAIDQHNISEKLVEIKNTNTFIDSIYLYNSNMDLIFSSNYSATLKNDFYDTDIVKILTNPEDNHNPLLIYRKMNYQIGANTVDTNVITVAFIDRNQNKIEDALIFNIKQSLLQNMVKFDKMDDSNPVFVMNDKGTVISHPDENMVNKNIKNMEYINSILASKKTEGVFVTNINKEKFLVTYIKTERMGWVFVSVQNYYKLFLRVTKLQQTVLVLTGIFVFLSIIIAMYVTNKIFLPFNKLVNRIGKSSQKQGQKQDINEIELLQNTYDDLVTNVGTLSEYKRNTSSAVKREVLSSIIYGEYLKIYGKSDIVNEYNIKLESPFYIALVIGFDHFNSLSSINSMDDIKLYRLAISNIAEELLSFEFMVEVCDIGEDRICIIVNLDDEDNITIDRITSISREIQKNVSKFINCTISIGIGSVEKDIIGVKRSYNNSLHALNYRLIYGMESIVNFAVIDQLDRPEYEYPVETERKLMEALKAGQKEKLQLLLDEFFNTITRYSFDEILLSLIHVSMILIINIKHMTSPSDEENDDININYQAANKLLSSFDTLQEIRLWINTLINEAMVRFDINKSCKSNEIIKTITDYINSNYHDSNMSVETLAEFVELSPNYLRKVFKDSMGSSLSSYISEIRFENAKRLLVSTNYHANEIAEMVGMSGNRYFYTAFKKAAGKSPDEYRKGETV